MRHIARTAAVALAVTSCVGLVATPALGSPAPLRVSGVSSLNGAAGAFTYDPAQLPAGARVIVGVAYPSSGSMVVTLHVKGAVPNREYGAHAHVAACGATGSVAGSHFQFVPDPVSPSTDPLYANPANEVWLDLETDGYGNGSAQTVVPWQPGDRRPASVVIHAMHTSTGSGTAGTAGTRLGCLTVPF